MAYRRTIQTEARKAENRRRLLEVARRLVADGGFAEIQISTVARLAGVATGTVYRYFPSKADLCVEVYRSACDREVQVAEEVARSDDSVAERLEAAVRTVAARAIRAQRTAYALIAEPVDPLLDAERLVYRRALAAVFERLVAEGLSEGTFSRQDPQISAACIVGAIMESLVNPLAPGSRPPPRRSDVDALLTEIVAFALRAVGGGGGTDRGRPSKVKGRS